MGFTRFFDLTQNKGALNKNENAPCLDHRTDCRDVDHVGCWIYAPERGICPYLDPKKVQP